MASRLRLPETLQDAPQEALSPTARLFEHAPGDSSPSSRWQHPPSFYCPISQQCMHDPVVLADGHTYERRYIERWLEHHCTSPVSGLLLPQKDMFPNHALRNAIEEYFQQVFSVHRRAIRQTIRGPGSVEGFRTNTPLLRTIDALMQCSLLMNADLSIERVLRRIMDEAKTLVGAEAASVFLLDANQRELYSTINSTGDVIRVPVSKGIAGHVASTGEPEIIFDAYGDARFNKSVDAKTGFTTRNIMCVPLKVKKGQVIGVVQLVNKCGPPTFHSDAERFGATPNTTDFTADDLQFLQVFASQAATAIVNSRSEEEQSGASSPTSLVTDAGTSSKPSSPGGSRTMDVVASLKIPSSFEGSSSERPLPSLSLCCPEAEDATSLLFLEKPEVCKSAIGPMTTMTMMTLTSKHQNVEGQEEEQKLQQQAQVANVTANDSEVEEDQEEECFRPLPSKAHSEPAMSIAHKLADNGEDTDVSIPPMRAPLGDDDDGHEQDIEDAMPSSSNIKRRSLSRRRISLRERSAKRVEIQLRRRWADLQDHSDNDSDGENTFNFIANFQLQEGQQKQEQKQEKQQQNQKQQQQHEQAMQMMPPSWKGSAAAFMQASAGPAADEHCMERANTFGPDHHVQHADDEEYLPPRRPKRRLHSRQLAAALASKGDAGGSEEAAWCHVPSAAVGRQPPSSSGTTVASTSCSCAAGPSSSSYYSSASLKRVLVTEGGGASASAAAAAAAASSSSSSAAAAAAVVAGAGAGVGTMATMMQDDPSSGSGLRSGPQSDDPTETAESGAAPKVSKRKSGRTRQRVAKWWAKVRCRTPSPETGVMSMCSSTPGPHS